MTSPKPYARLLTAEDLGIGSGASAASSPGSSEPDGKAMAPNDRRFLEINRLRDQFAGVILTGPPGTGKSWLAAEAANLLTAGDESRRSSVQFHAAYQYEDFMEGFRPRKDGKGFERKDGVFLEIVRAARNSSELHVLVIDELSRGDVGRIFGEALTYLERSKRGIDFTLQSGLDISIPHNLWIIATMNPLDRGVDEVDAAFERRFAKIEMLPDSDALIARLRENDVPDYLVNRIVSWFRRINSKARRVPAAAVGHTYFHSVVDESSLNDVWEYQLKYLVRRAFKFDDASYQEIVAGWKKIFSANSPQVESSGLGGTDGTPQQDSIGAK